jgi:formylglycine-generating enzyme required for sulfatase activity
MVASSIIINPEYCSLKSLIHRPFSGPAKMIFGLVLACLTISVSVPSASASQTLSQNQSDRDCISCHASDLKIHEKLDDIEKCSQCHSSAVAKTGLHKVAQQKQLQSSPPMDGLSVPDAATLNRGMQHPMYYTPSRLGSMPNKMILIPAGEFTMGSNDRLPDEGPQHKVSLPAYYIDTFEVTNLQYKKFIDATQRRSPRYFRNRTFPDGKADHPVTYVGWKDADDYCQWAGKRLPTEHEWEKAARGNDGRTFPWGNEFDSAYGNNPVRWEKLGNFGDTTPVGSFEKGISPYGLYDMSGNVWEWTASWYKAHPGNKTPSESYGERYKILKGGSWWDCSFYKCGLSAPVYNRSFFAKKVKNDTFGFRCAKDQGKDKR